MNSGFPAGRVDLDRLRRGPVEWSGTLSAGPAAWGLEGSAFAGAPRMSYRAEPGGHGGVRIVGQLATTLSLTCRRCLGDMQWPVEVEFDFRFDPDVPEGQEGEGVFALDPDAPVLDFSGPLREELVLASPEYPVCRDDCLGLCPICGADRNESECECSSEEPDPRWEVLRELVSGGQAGTAAPDDADDSNDG